MYNKLILFLAPVLLILIIAGNKAPVGVTLVNEPKAIHDEGPVKVTEGISGEAPSLFAENGKLHLAFASGDSIYYTNSSDKGKSFSAPVLVAVLKGLVNVGGRGPQIVGSNGILLIAAPEKSGNFYSYIKEKNQNKWKEGTRINDNANSAKEGFITLDATSSGHFFAVWLDLREGERNTIYGAGSKDGGKTWAKSRLIYKSPDGSVCECCKPALAMKNLQIAVMFRNNLKGDRDLYLIQSKDGGTSFDAAIKLGERSWKINGCPMDGGGLVIDDDGNIQTVWRREGDIYITRPGQKEELVGKGMKCMIDEIHGRYYIAFVNAGKAYCRKPDGSIIELGPGNGYLKLKAIDNGTLLCAWENKKKIYTATLN